ncbi:magnesium chelatase subunit H [Salinarimonas rosea]|uniref:magnesium chelatase subunit H n=1 Tax=Salinarimonas rosea TaxID=552063 RepID=UPI0003FECA84|nr:magnesium chelatase subunit H [Salinarimonas rosea]
MDGPAPACLDRVAAPSAAGVPLRFTIVTLDNHLAGPIARARRTLARELPGLTLRVHCATDFEGDPQAVARAVADIASADIVLCTMMFLEDHIRAVMPALEARRDACDAIVACMSAGEVTKLTRIGGLDMRKPASGPMALLKKLRPKSSKKDGAPGAGDSGARQLKLLRRIPQILRFIPGTAQDLRVYLLCLQYWLAGSEENVANMVRLLVDRYAAGPRRALRGTLKVGDPVEVAEVGVYHPRVPGGIAEKADALPRTGGAGRVGLVCLRSYIVAEDTAHYDGVIDALEASGLDVVPCFAAGLDARPAMERYFLDRDGRPTVDAVVSLTGFSLVGGPAYNDSKAAEEILARLDVPYLAAQASEFQSLAAWEGSERGLLPVEATMTVALPELDGATGPILFAGRGPGAGAGACGHCRRSEAERAAGACGDCMRPQPERVAMLAARVAKLVALRRTARAARKVGITLFNFPPNSGATGSAAFLAVFESLFNTLAAMKAAGYTVDLPESVDALRTAILEGNAARYGADANVGATIPVDDHVRRERHLAQIEAQWGPAPGRQQTDGASLHVLGARFGNVFVGVQPGFGYEGDPMRLLFERGFAPTHAFSAYYRWLREDFGAHAVLHFGTHGALEFMPGKQTGLSGACWPDRLIGDLPNLYVYAANNPSEGMIAKRRAAATLISYMTPPVGHAGLYRGLVDLKGAVERWRALPPEDIAERADLAQSIRAQAGELDFVLADPGPTGEADIAGLWEQVLEYETTLIPYGLHVIGRAPSAVERADLLVSVADASDGIALARAAAEALAAGATPAAAHQAAEPGRGEVTPDQLEVLTRLAAVNAAMATDGELPGILHALDGGYIRPVPGGDLLRTPAILPTGRNIHGFDPFRIPSAYAVKDGARQADELIRRHRADGNPLPETVAMVLWGTDSLKTEGAPIGQALALIGAAPKFDSYGRLCGAVLRPLDELGRPRIDVVATLSGIFRDLMPLQTRMLAEAAFLAASADEPDAMNFVAKHARGYMAEKGCDLETAALRIFSNADGTYGANVNQLIDAGAWDDEDELAETFSRRKCFAYGRSGKTTREPALFESMLSGADLAYQNLESVELGVTTVDQYYDSLGGISKAIGRARREAGRDAPGARPVPVYIGDQTKGKNVVRTLTEQVALEARTRMLNPKWYEGLLQHGYEGVRQIEASVTNTMGWSATTGQVQDWVYQRLTETFVLDAAMRERLAALNPKASVKMANRLIEAHERRYWTPDAATLAALRAAGEALEDRLEGITEGATP